jgi:hypothetical protein
LPDDGHPNPREVFAGDETPSGTTAFLQALMSMLGEVLDRVDVRLSSLETTLAAQGESAPEIGRRDAGEDVVAALERIFERLERLEVREPAGMTTEAAMTRLADLSGSVEDVGRRLAGLADIVTASTEAEDQWPEGLRAPLTALGEGVAVIGAQVTEEAEERNHQIANVAGTLERIFERLERLEVREPAGMTTEAAMTRLADLSDSVEDVGRRLEGLADILTSPPEAEDEWSAGLQASLAALGEGVVAMRAQLSAQGTENAAERNQEMTNVIAALERLGQQLEQLEERDPAKLGLERAVSRLDDLSAAVDSIGYGMAAIADLMTTPPALSGGQPEWPDGVRSALLALGEGVVELRQELQVQPVAELRGTARRLEGQLTLLTKQMASQPGPGAAVAMVAAGLAERFEERTEALTELLGAHATYVRQTWERIEGILDGGGFDQLAVGEALEHVIGNQELMADSVERVIGRLEDLHAMPQTADDSLAREALERLNAGMEGVGVKVDDVRRRLAALARTLELSSHETGPDPDAPDPASVIGRRATTAGRRLANDLGLRGRGRSPR